MHEGKSLGIWERLQGGTVSISHRPPKEVESEGIRVAERHRQTYTHRSTRLDTYARQQVLICS